MPELPEVETVCRGLAPHLIGRRVERLALNRADMRVPFPKDLKEVTEGRRIIALHRRAKYLLFTLEGGVVLIGHLGMSGTMVLVPPEAYQPRPHDHLLMDIEGNLRLVFHDPRRFGLMVWARQSALDTHPLLVHLGPEPLDNTFDGDSLHAALSLRKSAIKTVIMDQRVVVGVGNIYASEALFRAHIHPLQPSHSLKETQASRLSGAIKDVLSDAIDSGGSTLRDYVRSSGDAGYFQHSFAVYGRENMPCIVCKTPVSHLQMAGRSAFFCIKCQKLA